MVSNGLFQKNKNIYPEGPRLTSKAKQIAERLGKPEFKGTNGWLEKWKKHYNVKQVSICGVAGDVNSETADSRNERLPILLEGYKEDIWNLDETGCDWKALVSVEFSAREESSLFRE